MLATSEFRSPWVGDYFSTMVTHFAKNSAVTTQDNTARILLVCGGVDLVLNSDCITFEASAETTEDLRETCDVIERHLLRFAFREAPQAMVWTDRERP